MSDSPDTPKTPDYKFAIRLDIEMDMDNWYIGCNRVGGGHKVVDMKQRIPKEVADKIFEKTWEEACDFLEPYLKNKYKAEKDNIDKNHSLLLQRLNQKFDSACRAMVCLLKKPLYRDDFTFILTTFPRGSYNYKHGFIWVPVDWIEQSDAIRNFLHELLHFQLIHYWKLPDAAVGKLNEEQFEYLKESLTVILDDDLRPLIYSPDQGYEIHKEFRQELHDFWIKNKDFDKLIEFGLKRLPHYVT